MSSYKITDTRMASEYSMRGEGGETSPTDALIVAAHDLFISILCWKIILYA